MRKKVTLIVITFLIVSCRTEIGTEETALDRLVESAEESEVENPTQSLSETVADIQSKHKGLYATNIEVVKEPDSTELLALVGLTDTSANPDVSLTISAYKNEKSALKAFRNRIEDEACCIPDNDIVKLKNFENLQSFKNRASKILCADHIVVTMFLGDKITDNHEINSLIDSYFEKTDYKKLEIGTGGPANWTHK